MPFFFLSLADFLYFLSTQPPLAYFKQYPVFTPLSQVTNDPWWPNSTASPQLPSEAFVIDTYLFSFSNSLLLWLHSYSPGSPPAFMNILPYLLPDSPRPVATYQKHLGSPKYQGLALHPPESLIQLVLGRFKHSKCIWVWELQPWMKNMPLTFLLVKIIFSLQKKQTNSDLDKTKVHVSCRYER